MSDSRRRARVDRRDFLKIGGVSAATLGASGGLAAASGVPDGSSPAVAAAAPASSAELAPPSRYPKLAIITPYSPQKLAFATATGYEGVVVPLTDDFDPDKLSDSEIDRIIATSHETGARIISIECMWGLNHIHPDTAERAKVHPRFIRCLEFAHRLGCKFCGTFSGGMPGQPIDRQVEELAAVVNEKYVPVLDKLDISMGWENYPTPENFATVPATWDKIFARVPSPPLGLEFDPSHLVRQYIDPIATAWHFRDRIRAGHAKDTEIIEPVLNQVGIHGQGWWRYRIPGQGLLNWPKFITVLLQAGFQGGLAVEHEDDFWDLPNTEKQPDFPQERKDGFILAHRFLRQYLPARLS
ncbi:MAG TPA: sugar phosphate isomerase/epimerase [Terriglobia bacterium]|nr:sugar phosphate isomerase/epimerase [Terriglobia bacterium]